MDSKFLIFSHVGNCDPILKSCSAREDLICISRWSILAHTEIYWKLTVGKGPNSIQAEERKKKEKRGVQSTSAVCLSCCFLLSLGNGFDRKVSFKGREPVTRHPPTSPPIKK